MATIYRARDAQLDRDVAVKLLRPEFGRDPDFLARFRDEAKAAASLSHPNIVAVFDFGEEQSDPYIVMELIDGQDLSSILRENGPLPPRQAARVSAEVAKALQAAHVRGIVHRDVKPSNILVGRDGRVKVADFGIARALDEAQVTLPGVTMGSVHYFSPEQARGEPATQASDIYSLGIVLYESLTGQRPFSGDGAAAVALARLTTTPPRPSRDPARRARRSSTRSSSARWRSIRPPGMPPLPRWPAPSRAGWPTRPPPGTAAVAGAAGAAAAVGAAATVASAQARPNAVPYPPDAYARSAPPAAPVTTTRHAAAAPVRRWRGRGRRWRLEPVGLGRRPARHRHPGDRRLPRVPHAHGRWRRGAVGQSQRVPVRGDRRGAQVRGHDDHGRRRPRRPAPAWSSRSPGTEERTDVEPGIVLTQDPAEGEIGRRGLRGRRSPSPSPRASVTVPDIRNLPRSEALQLIVGEGLTVGTETSDFSPTVPAGSVISQSPSAGHRGRARDAGGLRPLRRPRAHAQPDADTRADPHAHARPDPDPDAHADADPGAGQRRRLRVQHGRGRHDPDRRRRLHPRLGGVRPGRHGPRPGHLDRDGPGSEGGPEAAGRDRDRPRRRRTRRRRPSAPDEPAGRLAAAPRPTSDPWSGSRLARGRARVRPGLGVAPQPPRSRDPPARARRGRDRRGLRHGRVRRGPGRARCVLAASSPPPRARLERTF